MNLIMENWRRFINESLNENLKIETLGLNAYQESSGINITLVDLSSAQAPETPMVIGMIETSVTDKPCIPKTHEIGAVAVHPSAVGRGIGTYLYEVAALFVLKNYDGGITSDHMASTTTPAANIWKKLENSLGYVKRKTDPGSEEYNEDGEIIGGSDTLDYNDSTPDPNDDCTTVSDGKPATDHSLQIPPERISKIESTVMTQINNFDDYLTNIASNFDEDAKNDILNNIIKQANRLFSTEYNPENVGIYGDNK